MKRIRQWRCGITGGTERSARLGVGIDYLQSRVKYPPTFLVPGTVFIESKASSYSVTATQLVNEVFNAHFIFLSPLLPLLDAIHGREHSLNSWEHTLNDWEHTLNNLEHTLNGWEHTLNSDFLLSLSPIILYELSKLITKNRERGSKVLLGWLFKVCCFILYI